MFLLDYVQRAAYQRRWAVVLASVVFGFKTEGGATFTTEKKVTRENACDISNAPDLFCTWSQFQNGLREQEEALTVINGTIYDVSHFVGKHPGGKIVLKIVGIDGSKFFRNKHPSINPDEHLRRIGFIASDSPEVTKETGAENSSQSEEVFTWELLHNVTLGRRKLTAIDGVVYDIGGLLKSHPGGPAIKQIVGSDGTALFHTHHFNVGSTPTRVLEGRRVGIIAPWDKSQPTIRFGKFYADISEQLRTELRGQSRNSEFLKAIAWLVPIMLAVISFFAFRYGFSSWKSRIACVLLVLYGQSTHGVIHTVSHMAVFDSVSSTSSFVAFARHIDAMAPRLYWGNELQNRVLHYSHHTYGGSDEHDPEANTLRGLKWAAMGIKTDAHAYPTLLSSWIYARQHLLYFIPAPWFKIVNNMNNEITKQKMYDMKNLWGVLKGSMGLKLKHLVLAGALMSAWFVPSCKYSSMLKVVFRYVVLMYVGLILNNVMMDIMHWGDEHLHDGQSVFSWDPAEEWAVNVVTHSSNVGQLAKPHDLGGFSLVSAYAWFEQIFLTFGANMQIEHHLFPSLNPIHYPAAQRAIQRACRQHNLSYVSHNLLSAANSRYKLLQRTGSLNSTLRTHSVHKYAIKEL